MRYSPLDLIKRLDRPLRPVEWHEWFDDNRSETLSEEQVEEIIAEEAAIALGGGDLPKRTACAEWPPCGGCDECIDKQAFHYGRASDGGPELTPGEDGGFPPHRSHASSE